jgi:spore germination protein YaaH
MPARGLFVTNWTEAEVLQVQQKAKDFMMQGKVLMSYGDGGSSGSKQFVMPVDQILEECAYALKKLNPSVYGGKKRILYTDYRAGKDF